MFDDLSGEVHATEHDSGSFPARSCSAVRRLSHHHPLERRAVIARLRRVEPTGAPLIGREMIEPFQQRARRAHPSAPRSLPPSDRAIRVIRIDEAGAEVHLSFTHLVWPHPVADDGGVSRLGNASVVYAPDRLTATPREFMPP